MSPRLAEEIETRYGPECLSPSWAVSAGLGGRQVGKTLRQRGKAVFILHSGLTQVREVRTQHADVAKRFAFAGVRRLSCYCRLGWRLLPICIDGL